MKVYKDAKVVVNLEKVSYIDYFGKYGHFTVRFHFDKDEQISSEPLKTKAKCQQILKMCYDTMAEEEWD